MIAGVSTSLAWAQRYGCVPAEPQQTNIGKAMRLPLRSRTEHFYERSFTGDIHGQESTTGDKEPPSKIIEGCDPSHMMDQDDTANADGIELIMHS